MGGAADKPAPPTSERPENGVHCACDQPGTREEGLCCFLLLSSTGRNEKPRFTDEFVF